MTAVADLLALAHTALDSAGVPWAKLRDDAGDPIGTSAEVDLLIGPADLPEAARVLAGAGFLPAGRGLGTHRFFLSYDAGADRWLKLDVVTDLAFGRRRELVAAEAGEVLARRVRTPGGWALSPPDAFWALVLHCLLDRGSLPRRHLERLAAAAPDAGASPVTTGLDAALLARLVAAAAAADEVELRAGTAPLRRALTRARPIRTLLRRTRAGATRAGVKLGVPSRHGLVVALLGPDGSGKSTLAAGLRSAVPIRSGLLYGGMYADTGHGSVARLVHLARYALTARYETRRGGIVVSDRHPLESPGRRAGLRGGVRRILYRVTPAPHLTLLLDCDGATMFHRKGEHSPARLEDQGRRLRTLADALPRTAVLDARLPRDDVRAAASQAVWHSLRLARRA